MALTTQLLYRRWTRGSLAAADGEDARLQAAIDTVHSALEAHCFRRFSASDYTRWIQWDGTRNVMLQEWPILALYCASIAESNVLTVKHSARRAFIRTSATGVTTAVYSDGGSKVETVYSFSTYPTLALLSAALLAAGCEVTLSPGYGTTPCEFLRPGQSFPMGNGDSADLVAADDFTQAQIDPDSDHGIIIPTAIGEGFDGGFSWPDSSRRAMTRHDDKRLLFVQWQAGYELPVDAAGHVSLATAGTVPADLQQVAHFAVKALLDAANQDLGPAQSANIGAGDFSYSLVDGGRGIVEKVFAENAATLSRYRRLM